MKNIKNKRINSGNNFRWNDDYTENDESTYEDEPRFNVYVSSDSMNMTDGEPRFENITEDECRKYCRKVWKEFKAGKFSPWGYGPLDPNEDDYFIDCVCSNGWTEDKFGAVSWGKYAGKFTDYPKELANGEFDEIDSSKQIKSVYTRPDSERFDEYGYFNPYTPTADELLKTDEIKKVLSEELSKAYEPDPMDKYTGIDTTNERIDTVIEEVAKQFNVDTDYVDELAGEIQREEYTRAMAEPEWIHKHCNDEDKFWAWQNGDISLEELGIDKEQMKREVDETVRKYVNSSHQIKSSWFRYTVEINTNDGNVYREDYEGANRSEIRKDIEKDFPNMKNFTILDYEDLSACYSSRRIKLSKEK